MAAARRSPTALAPVAATALPTVSKIGIPSKSVPPFPGVTPATICVPYSRQAWVWNWPVDPVIPWVMTFVCFVDENTHWSPQEKGNLTAHCGEVNFGGSSVAGTLRGASATTQCRPAGQDRRARYEPRAAKLFRRDAPRNDASVADKN